MPVRIAHLSDVHIGPAPWPRLRDLHPKRVLGYANWMRSRRLLHRPEVADLLVADAADQSVDHILVSGDLTNFGLPAEHVRALAWLERIGKPETVSVVPGNHDVYTRLRRDPGIERWHAFYSGQTVGGKPFPFVRTVGQVALIGLNSAIVTAPAIAAGLVGEPQLQRLAEILEDLRGNGLFRLVMIHHPPLPGQASHRRALRDAARLQDVLAAHGAELVVHGHNHRSMTAWTRGPQGSIPVIGVASCSASRADRPEPASYNIYEVGGSAARGERSSWSLTVRRRGFSAEEEAVVSLHETSIEVPGAPLDERQHEGLHEKSSTRA